MPAIRRYDNGIRVHKRKTASENRGFVELNAPVHRSGYFPTDCTDRVGTRIRCPKSQRTSRAG